MGALEFLDNLFLGLRIDLAGEIWRLFSVTVRLSRRWI